MILFRHYHRGIKRKLMKLGVIFPVVKATTCYCPRDFKDAPILILDEPTASLDTRNELAVQKALDQLVKDKTVLIIAHRLSTIVGAHCIYVLENGSIAEQGTHQTLLEQKGRYAAFWQCQQGNITQ